MNFLIVYNNDSSDAAGGFFAFCGEEMELEAEERGLDHIVMNPPNMCNQQLLQHLPTCQVCFIANHGDAKSIAGSDGDIVSINTNNTQFSGKLLYAVSCSCAKELKNSLIKVGLQSFWGYDNELKLWYGYPQYARSCMAGIKSLMDGKNIREAKADMLEQYNNDIAELEAQYPENPILSALLLDNREALVICGDDELKLTDLK
jgi:hypothetical protein